MGNLQSQFELEFNTPATYRKGCSDYHTLRYVNWLEAKVAKNLTPNNSASTKSLDELEHIIVLVLLIVDSKFERAKEIITQLRA